MDQFRILMGMLMHKLNNNRFKMNKNEIEGLKKLEEFFLASLSMKI